MTNYKHETLVNADIESTFDWFEHEGSFRRLMPPWEVAEEVRADDSLEVGSQRVFRFPAPGATICQNDMGCRTYWIRQTKLFCRYNGQRTVLEMGS